MNIIAQQEKVLQSIDSGKITDKEYEHVLNVWSKFEIKPMKDYHELYLSYDILLLADVFEKFRNRA